MSLFSRFVFSVRNIVFPVLVSSLFLVACGEPPEARTDISASRIAVSNSWIECCLRDLTGNDREPLRICPPGGCPGHFDIRPGTAADLRTCRLMLLFDFQESMKEKLAALSSGKLKAVAIDAPEGLCIPANYLTACESVQLALNEVFPEQIRATSLQGIRNRMGVLENEIRGIIQAEKLEGTKVVVSGHQAVFCRWLGLETVAVYSGSEAVSPAQIEALLAKGESSGVRFVIANLQESAQAGEALATQLKIPVVVFSNFPSMDEGETTFDALVRSNVARLVEAARSHP